MAGQEEFLTFIPALFTTKRVSFLGFLTLGTNKKAMLILIGYIIKYN